MSALALMTGIEQEPCQARQRLRKNSCKLTVYTYVFILLYSDVAESLRLAHRRTFDQAKQIAA